MFIAVWWRSFLCSQQKGIPLSTLTLRLGGRWRLRATVAAVIAAAAVVVAMMGFGTPNAHADLINKRQVALRESTSALFMHWGMLTSPGFTSCSAWENAITSGGWSAGYWVQEAQKLHASHITLASFHSKLGYGRPWKSSIPGTCSTNRDFLGELITAAHAKGIQVVLYMTNDAQWHDFNNHEWMNSSAFSKFAGHTVNMDTQPGFGEFSYDNFFDVLKTHPGLDGFWIDNINAYWTSHDLWNKLYAAKPSLTISNNNEDTPVMDMISNEQKTGMTPSYDMPQAYFTAQPRLTEADYKLPDTGPWWFAGGNPSVNTALNVGRYIANAGNSVKSLMDETPMVNGKFPSNQANFNNFFNSYIGPVFSSVNGVEGGGFMWGGMPGGNFGSGAYGYTTITKTVDHSTAQTTTDPTTQYVHVVTKPSSGSSVKIRDGGYHVTGVSNMRGGSVSSSQSNGFLTITNNGSWDKYDTVFKVTTTGTRTGVVSGVKASANASASGHAAGNLVDGSYLNYWQSNGSLSATITLDQGSSKHVQYLALNQREDSITQTASSSRRIHAYTIQTSADGTSFSTLKTGNLPNARGAQYIDLNTTARFVRLVVNSTYASNHTLRIDELWLASANA
jgi:alpha-L-fucosidase